MIIECPCKKKKFNIDINLIPAEGRNLQCGSCDRIWFYKKQDPISETLQINEDIAIKENEESDNSDDDISNDQEVKLYKGGFKEGYLLALSTKADVVERMAKPKKIIGHQLGNPPKSVIDDLLNKVCLKYELS